MGRLPEFREPFSPEEPKFDRLKKIHRRLLMLGSYPGSLSSAVITIVTSWAFHLAGIDITAGLTDYFQKHLEISNFFGCVIASLFLWTLVCSLRKFLVRRLLQYRGWIHEGNRPSIKTKLFLVAVRGLNGWFFPLTKKLYGLQGVLPILPVPAIEQSVKEYVSSMEPLLPPEKYVELERQGSEFLQKHGSQLQRSLMLKYWSSQNYVSDWWEQYAYLASRLPLPINSNFYCLESNEEFFTNNVAAKAAMLVYGALKIRESIEKQTLQPLIGQGVIPLCSVQYERMFNTTRIPGETMDSLMHLESSHHIIVYHKGKYFHVPVCHNNGQMLLLPELQLQFLRILEDESKPADGEEKLAALTTLDRSTWARTRKAFFSNGLNKISLDCIEKSAFVMPIDDEEFYAENTDEVPHLNNFGRACLYGNGYNRWFDKSFNWIIGKNGRSAFNAEHSWGDGTIITRMYQIVDPKSMLQREDFDENGLINHVLTGHVPQPSRLAWELPEECILTIESAAVSMKSCMDNVDLQINHHKAYGKAFLKKCKVSPDAFIQMALQLAYYRDQGEFTQTYEAAMTRFYKFGRTETVRSCTRESCDWVLAMQNPDLSNQEKLRLFRLACSKHQQNYRRSMSGKGFDRHMFALLVISKYLKIESEFLKDAVTSPWPLSTSQTPTWGKTMDSKPILTSGGGFGATCSDGYGVSYVFGGEHDLVFHISSYKDSLKTDSLRLWKEIVCALGDIRKMHLYEAVQDDPVDSCAKKIS
ncbi:unnamed protein product [Allacma fusca]|uniref:Choline/carnitine acyltransferase domain-containing protein n=1 Tax=Allacma fusca TaxID=39272 RepID=A0A8J2JZ76_9HEXA|nr:unnamed protein product [Allacma fusca]